MCSLLGLIPCPQGRLNVSAILRKVQVAMAWARLHALQSKLEQSLSIDEGRLSIALKQEDDCFPVLQLRVKAVEGQAAISVEISVSSFSGLYRVWMPRGSSSNMSQCESKLNQSVTSPLLKSAGTEARAICILLQHKVVEDIRLVAAEHNVSMEASVVSINNAAQLFDKKSLIAGYIVLYDIPAFAVAVTVEDSLVVSFHLVHLRPNSSSTHKLSQGNALKISQSVRILRKDDLFASLILSEHTAAHALPFRLPQLLQWPSSSTTAAACTPADPLQAWNLSEQGAKRAWYEAQNSDQAM